MYYFPLNMLMLDKSIQVAHLQNTHEIFNIAYLLTLPLQGHSYLHHVEEH